jgi:3'-phosphoadenosine 5'-phosphosulfate (PAPS) 3'-phosphatase
MASESTAATDIVRINLLDLAAAAVGCTVAASTAIRQIAGLNGSDSAAPAAKRRRKQDTKNTRQKDDGSVVTDADYIAQGIIVQALHQVSDAIDILGEESVDEMQQHLTGLDRGMFLSPAILSRARAEVRRRRLDASNDPWPLSACDAATAATEFTSSSRPDDAPTSNDDDIDVARVRVIVDPLDGTKSYSVGDYDSVSILICICVDGKPVFGVIGKPFGYSRAPDLLTPMLDSTCCTLYGGTLLDGVYVAGGPRIPHPLKQPKDNTTRPLPRAVISSSRSKGVVRDFCEHVSAQGLIHPEPLLVSGAGEKSVRLLLPVENEGLWFFPVGGTSRWDIAAPDALIRVLGGKLTNKYGQLFDYSLSGSSENSDGVVVAIDPVLHDRVIEIFNDADSDWLSRT